MSEVDAFSTDVCIGFCFCGAASICVLRQWQIFLRTELRSRILDERLFLFCSVLLSLVFVSFLCCFASQLANHGNSHITHHTTHFTFHNSFHSGNGLFIERHHFIQAITPMNSSCGGDAADADAAAVHAASSLTNTQLHHQAT